MAYFTKATFQFLSDLSENNNKEWFDENRDRYEDHWKAPALEVIRAVSAELQDIDPPLKAEPKINGSLRRINRDVRFSKDKSPYNASLHLIFWAGGHPNRSPGTHVVLHPGSVGVGAGMWGFKGETLNTYRKRIMDDADRTSLLDALAEAENIGCLMDDPDLARIPRGFEAEGDAARLVRYKAVVARTFDDDTVIDAWCGAGGVDRIIATARALSPLNKWLLGLE